MNKLYNSESPVVGSEKKLNVTNRKEKLYLEYYIDGKRIRRSTGFQNTKKNVEHIKKVIIPKIQAKIILGEYHQKKSKSLKEYAYRYLASVEHLVSYETKKSRVKNVVEKLGVFKIDKITRSDVKKFLSEFRSKPYTAKAYLTVLRGVFEVAMDDEVITTDPTVNIKVGKYGKKEPDPFSPEEVQALMNAATGIFQNYLGIAFNTGMRIGEIIGLMDSDIDIHNIHIRRTMTRGRINSPKTVGSIRDVPIFDAVRPYLVEQKKLAKGLYLFDNGDGRDLKDSGYFRRAWKSTIKKAGVRYRKLYNTRHTFITAMLNSGQYTVLQIAQIVGHSSPRMIMTTYAGFVKSEHLKIDVTIDLYRHNTGTVDKTVKSYEFKNSSKTS